MSIGIIVAGHGHFASGIGSSLQLIMGMPDNIKLIDFSDGDNIVHLEQNFRQTVTSFGESEIIVLVDLFSGSPFNVAMRLANENPHIHLFYGVNLGMLMEIASKSQFTSSVEEVTAGIVDTARSQIGAYTPNPVHADEETDAEEEDEL